MDDEQHLDASKEYTVNAISMNLLPIALQELCCSTVMIWLSRRFTVVASLYVIHDILMSGQAVAVMGMEMVGHYLIHVQTCTPYVACFSSLPPS